MLSLLAGVLLSLEPSAPPELPREFRGAWVATVDNIDWPSKPGLPIEVQKAELRHLLRSLASLHFNAVVFQVRPNCDALYESAYEPSSWYVTGKQGKAIGWDPLEFTVKEGHALGLEVHAWFNPFRAKHPAQKGECCSTHVSYGHPEWVKTYGRYGWLDPGIDKVREHSLNVILDVVKRYDIDGVHLDDYFYPYPEGSRPFPDDGSYSEYTGQGGRLSRSDWRRSNVDELVQNIGSGIRKIKPWVKFGISPFGIYRPNVPAGIRAGVDQYDDLSADALKWWKLGWVDYLSPQLYWKTTAPYQPFEKLLDWWSANNEKKRHLWPGLYTGQVAKSGGNWPLSEVKSQIGLTRKSPETKGQVHFSAKCLLADTKGIATELKNGLYKQVALVPNSPWMSSRPIVPPNVKRGTGSSFEWAPVPDARFYAVFTHAQDRWELVRVGDSCSMTLGAGKSPSPDAVAVVAISRTGAASRPAVIRPQG